MDWVLRSLGLLIVAVAIFFDSLGTGGEPGFGNGQRVLLAAGSFVVVLGFVRGRARRIGVRVALVCASACVMLFLAEAITYFFLTPHATRNPSFSLRGYVRPAAWGGYELTPGWHGRFEDGILSIDVAINAFGDRDDPPDASDARAEQRVLLIGDSFAFGWGLEAKDTIDAQIEAVSQGRVSSYTIGVPGYGPADTLERLRESRACVPTTTIFVMCENDLRSDNRDESVHTAFEGMIVSRRRSDGSPRDPSEWRAEIACAERMDKPAWQTEWRGFLGLNTLRRRVAGLLDPAVALAEGPPEDYDATSLASAVKNTVAMQALARERGGAFVVVVIPGRGEAAREQQFAPVARYVSELERLSIPVVEVRDRLKYHDYLAHDAHLSRSGAKVVAQAIVEYVQR